MRSCFLLIVVVGCCLAGCAAEVDEPSPPRDPTRAHEVTLLAASSEPVMDVCALASALPVDDICSLACDPVAMAARMVDDGNERGQCYQLYCSLTEDAHVLVGVCLPP